MSYVIAVAGKGGTGKTTTSALIIRYLLKNGKTPILAVDADPNCNFAESIGIEVDRSIGTVLSDFLSNRGDLPQGMSKQSFLEFKLHQILKEGKDIDMLVMGCPEGPGCYCSANSILRAYFDSLSNNYKYIVIDNEAGMEHFSRKTNAEIDLLIICSNYSLKGLKIAKKLSDLVDELKLDVKDRYLLLNYTPENLDETFLDNVKKIGIPYIGNIVKEKLIEDYDIKGISITDLPDNSLSVKSIDEIMEKILN
ncbi:MAG: AAA family ATPase [Spirochaetota bacterium]|nr:AAA family ATPase [Spirochaetota bacterium]